MPSTERLVERRVPQSRPMDEIRAWLPIVLSIATTLIALMLAYGRVSSRLDLIEYRLMKIEERIPLGKASVP